MEQTLCRRIAHRKHQISISIYFTLANLPIVCVVSMAFPFPATEVVSFQEHREVDIMLSVTRRGPLDEACWELLREIDDVSVPDEDDVIVLIWASSDNVLEVIRVLLKHNVEPSFGQAVMAIWMLFVSY